MLFNLNHAVLFYRRPSGKSFTYIIRGWIPEKEPSSAPGKKIFQAKQSSLLVKYSSSIISKERLVHISI